MTEQGIDVRNEERLLRSACLQGASTLPEEVFWLLAEAADELVPNGELAALPEDSPALKLSAALEAARDRLHACREQSESVPEVMACARASRLIGQALQLLAAEPAR